MKIRTTLVLITGLAILLAIVLYSFISTMFVNRYFQGYLESEYSEDVERIKQSASDMLDSEPGISNNISDGLSAYLNSVIYQISILDNEGAVIAISRNEMPMMRGNMMRQSSEETDYFNIYKDGEVLGTLIVTRSASLGSSQTATAFKKSLLIGIGVSSLAAILMSLSIVLVMSSKMAGDLKNTAQAALTADTTIFSSDELSRIKEIQLIQQSLESLSRKLNLKKRASREKIDQLAHEARTPLTILKTNCEGARDNIIEMDSDRINGCLVEIDRLTKLLNNMSSVIEYDNEVTVMITKINLNLLIKNIINAFKIQYDKKHISLEYEGEPDVIINSDSALISQIIYNLLSNSYKFTPEKGKVVVSLVRDKESVIIKVCDSGPGIPLEQREKIFEAYNRGGLSGKTSGEGLGLYIARKNAKALGGLISVADSELGGVCFILKLPE